MKTFLAVELAIAAALAWLVSLLHRSSEFSFTEVSFDRLQAASLALAVGVAAAVAIGAVGRRNPGAAASVAIAGIGVCVVIGNARLSVLPDVAAFAAASLWLVTAAAVLASLFIGSATFARVPRGAVVAIGAVAATGVLAAALGAGRDLTATSDLGVGGRAAMGVHLAVLVAAAACGLATAARRSRPAVLRDPVILAASAWFAIAVVERVVHVLPLDVYRDPYIGAYRPWALVSTVYLPLIASGAVIVALGWSLAVRPRVERLSSGVLVVPDRDPVAMLRDDLAAWAGDPTLQLAYSDPEGHWLLPSGARHDGEAPYHRATTVVTQGGLPIGLLDHDIALQGATDALQTAAALAGVAFHANRLLALSEARLAETRQLGQRLLVADAATRDEVLAELEAGPIGRLEACADAVRWGAPIGEVVERLRTTTADVRLLSHGLYPPELIEGGLRAVLGDRAGAPARRFPIAVEITAYLLATDDPAGWFEDTGPALWVHRSRPIADRSTTDRVQVLGGTVDGCSVCLPVEEA